MSHSNGSQPSALSNLTSIIIPCCGMLEYTKLLVPSLLEHTREPYELIFMDIGSLDGTAEYLAGLAAGVRHCRVTVVHAETDLDIPDACREALGTASGEYVVLLNNDTIVTEQLVGPAHGPGEIVPGSRPGRPHVQLRGAAAVGGGGAVPDSGQRSAFSDQRSAFSGQRSAFSGQRSPFTADR